MDQKRNLSLSIPRNLSLSIPRNPIGEIHRRVRAVESRFNAWVKAQPAHIEAAVETAGGALNGFAVGGLLGLLSSELTSALPMRPNQGPLEAMKRAQVIATGPLVQARNFAVMTGSSAGISCFMKRVRGVDDFQNSVVAGFGSGVLYSLVSGSSGPNLVGSAVQSGVTLAVVQGLAFMWSQKFSKPPVDSPLYNRTRGMLTNLGLERYEKNFKKGALTDNTLPLLTDSALCDIKIPPGARLLILDHIQRDPDLKN